MYEMRAQRATATPESVLLWHVLPPGGAGAALCGCSLTTDVQEPVRSSEDVLSDQYCPSCMAAVGEAMETRDP